MADKKVTVVAGEDAAPEAMEPSVELLDKMGSRYRLDLAPGW